MLGTNTRVPTLAVNALRRAAGGSVSLAPTGVTLSPDTIDQADASGTVVGVLTAIDATPAATHTFAVVGNSEFTVLVANLKTSATFVDETYYFRELDIRVVNSAGQQVTAPVVVYITPTDDSNESGLPPPDEDQVVSSPGFPVPPIVQSADGVLKITGKNNGLGKIIIDLNLIPGRWYKVRWTADWSQMSALGTYAFFGFGWRRGNEDFHFTGFKNQPDGTVKVVTISGAGKFQKQKASFDLVDHGVAVGYTKSGPNWGRLDLAESGVTYDLSSTLDGDELLLRIDDQIPSPLGNVSLAVQAGLAIFLENNDKGPFSISVDVWESNVAGYGRKYGESYGVN